MSGPLDSQQVELIGRGVLVSSLARGGIEVAQPVRDRGVDLIAYVDDDPRGFFACPLQIKASSGMDWSLWEKYANKPSLLLVYVWNAVDGPVRYVAMTYPEAFAVAEAHGWVATASWTDHHHWRTKVAPGLEVELARFEIKDHQWRDRIWSASTAIRDT